MFHGDHNPAHFHARYDDERAIIEIETLRLLRGNLPPRALRFVLEWAALHQDELRENWRLAQRQAPLMNIRPLE